jgi:competence protein ComEA
MPHVLLLSLFLVGVFSCAKLPSQQRSALAHRELRQSNCRRINLNNASVAELEQLPGVGKVLAERIVTHRTNFGPFRRVDHLLIVRGISERKFLELRPFVSAN